MSYMDLSARTMDVEGFSIHAVNHCELQPAGLVY